jgi:hypothetical protein
MNIHTPKWTSIVLGSSSFSGLSKLQRAIAKVKTPLLEDLFTSLESYWSVDVQNGLALTNLDNCNTSYGQKKGRKFDFRPWKVRNWPDSFAWRWCATRRWKALDEGYNFGLDLIPIRGLHKKLWTCKVARVPTLTILGLALGSPETKSRSDATPARRCRVYYMGEGGGFPRVRAVVSLVNPRSPMAFPSTKGVLALC